MPLARYLVSAFWVSLLASLPAGATNLVTGNGFGFAVVSPQTGTLSKFYAHPYSFVRPDATNPLSEGVETANFIREIRWDSGNPLSASSEYVDDSQVIHTKTDDGEGFFFMPFGLRQAALIIGWEPGPQEERTGSLHVEWSHPIKSQKTARILGVEMKLLKFDGVQESLLLIPMGTLRPGSATPEQVLAASHSWALVSIENDCELEQVASAVERWRRGLEPRALAKREVAEIERWRVKPAVDFRDEAERHVWRQSEVVLRMAQSREPNRPLRNGNGLIIASLPDGVWFTPWVRDMAYATVGLARMGHKEEARAALLAYFNAHPTGKMRAQTQGADYQISVVRYFGNGAEEPFFTMEGNTNIEFDDWGLALWVLGEYEKQYSDFAFLRIPTYRGNVYESARDFVVKPLMENMEKYDHGLIVATDTSIWEEHQEDAKHFAFSTAAAIVGLRNFAETARQAGDEPARTEVLKDVDLLEEGFDSAFIRGGKLHGTLEEGVKNDIDGALLAIINLGIVTDPATVSDTIERMELLKVDSGGYKRVRSTYTDPAIFEYWYEKQEFLFVDLSLAEVFRRQGRNAEADAILKRIVDKAAVDHNLIPEMYVAVPCSLFPGKMGDPTGAMPMVGYGAGAYILHVLERQELRHGR